MCVGVPSARGFFAGEWVAVEYLIAESRRGWILWLSYITLSYLIPFPLSCNNRKSILTCSPDDDDDDGSYTRIQEPCFFMSLTSNSIPFEIRDIGSSIFVHGIHCWLAADIIFTLQGGVEWSWVELG